MPLDSEKKCKCRLGTSSGPRYVKVNNILTWVLLACDACDTPFGQPIENTTGAIGLEVLELIYSHEDTRRDPADKMFYDWLDKQ